MSVPSRADGLMERAMRFALFRAETWGKRIGAASGPPFVRSAGAPAASVHTFTNPAELAALARLALLAPAGTCGLEIGSYLGASTRYLAAGLSYRGLRLYCVDTWQNETMPDGPRDTMAAFRANLGPLMDWVVPIRKASQDLTPADVPEPVALAFIDGDHSYEAASSDVRTVLPMLTQGAVLAFHDSGTFQGVGRVIGELLAGGEWVIAGAVDTLVWLRRGAWGPDGRPVWSDTR